MIIKNTCGIKSLKYDNLIDVTLLDRASIEYLVDIALFYSETFAHGAGFEDDIEIINEIIDKCTVNTLVVSHLDRIN